MMHMTIQFIWAIHLDSISMRYLNIEASHRVHHIALKHSGSYAIFWTEL